MPLDQEYVLLIETGNEEDGFYQKYYPGELMSICSFNGIWKWLRIGVSYLKIVEYERERRFLKAAK